MNENSKYFYHFGIRLENDKVKKNITRNNYYSRDKEDKDVKPTELAINNSLRNFDLNINYFHDLNEEDFLNNLKKYVMNNNMFEKVDDLSKYNKDQGIYILVLEKYKQIYIGQTTRNLRDRIVRHWRNELPLLKTPFIRSGILPIDCFGALDTSMIYVYKSSNQDEIDQLESDLIENFPLNFIMNKTIGGKAYSYKDLADRVFFKKIVRDFENKKLEEI